VQAVTANKAAAVARSAAARLAAMVEPDGRFTYRYFRDDPSFVNTMYSEVRHVAAVWALIDFERQGWAIPGLAEAIDRAAGFMTASLFRPYGSADALCVHDEGFIKLAGSAVGVAASIRLHRRSGDADHLDRAARLARYVELQRLPDGDFVQVRTAGPISEPHPLRAEPFMGQGVFALALAAEATGESRWLDQALDSARKLAGRGHGIGALAHWMAYALEALVCIRREPWLVDYGARMARSMIDDEASRRDGTSTPIACQTEGLLAYARLRAALGGDADPSVEAVMKRIAGNLRRQLAFHDPSGGFVHSHDKQEVRIDYVMHNGLGFLGYARLAAGSRGGRR